MGLPSSAKLTDYKDKYEDRPLRGMFTGFGGPPEPVKPVSTKQKEDIPVPSSLPEAIFKPTAPPSHPREIIKTPDEVDDLPIHEEVESNEHDIYDQTTHTSTKSQELEVTSPTVKVKGKLQMKEEILPEKHEREDVKESKEKKDKFEDKEKSYKDKLDDKDSERKTKSPEKEAEKIEKEDKTVEQTQEEEISREEK